MIGKLKQTWRRYRAHLPRENGVTFVHHKPQRGNIGDDLCSPRHYFAFTDPRRQLVIIGGGVFVEFGYRMLAKLGFLPENSVLWGSGLSLRTEAPPEPVVSLRYLHWGLRDYDRVTAPAHFLPCVSCLHPMLDCDGLGEGTLLFLNADPAVTSVEELSAIREYCDSQGWKFLLNDCSAVAIATALADSRRIITNSYHGTYWGLLSGREVALLGYSSKFRSLLGGLGLAPEKMLPVARGRGDLLGCLRQTARVDAAFQQLENPVATREQFRQINLTFAEALVARQIVGGYQLKEAEAISVVLSSTG